MIDIELLFSNMGRGSTVTVYTEFTINPFAFILNVQELLDSHRMEIAPDHWLRRAQPNEIKFIKETIKGIFGKYSDGNLWERKIPHTEGRSIKLRRSKWRYYVVEISSDTKQLDLLEQALSVCSLPLEVGFTVYKVDAMGVAITASTYHPPRLFQSLSTMEYVQNSETDFISSISSTEASEIGEIYSRLLIHDHSIFDLRRTFELVMELKDLPSFSPLQILGYFAILESVLTHHPAPEDRYDSITRQIKSKLALLDSRWSPKIDYIPFGTVAHDKVWSKMYAYRSAIARGAMPNFKTDLLLLKSADNANRLIRDVVKKTIRQALIEPQLIADLHDC